VVVPVDCGTDQRYVIPAKVEDESTIRPLTPSRHSKDELTQYLGVQLRWKLYRKPGQDDSNALSRQLSEIDSVLFNDE
jgi:hypothetical protein